MTAACISNAIMSLKGYVNAWSLYDEKGIKIADKITRQQSFN